MIDIRPATLRDACYVAANMRDRDRREIEATIGRVASWPAVAAASLQLSGDDAFCAFYGGQPATVIGVTHNGYGRGTGWCFGTNDLFRTMPALTRFLRRTWIISMIEGGLRRVEVRSLLDRDISHRWLESIGYQREGIAEAFGVNGEDFVTYAFVALEADG